MKCVHLFDLSFKQRPLMQILWWEHMRGEQMEDRFYMEEGEEEDQS